QIRQFGDAFPDARRHNPDNREEISVTYRQRLAGTLRPPEPLRASLPYIEETAMARTRVPASMLLLLAFVTSCGGGGGSGGSGPKTTLVKVDIHWSARSRTLHAPSSALSAILTLQKASPDGTDFKWTINRDAALADHTGSYTSNNPAKVGTW